MGCGTYMRCWDCRLRTSPSRTWSTRPVARWCGPRPASAVTPSSTSAKSEYRRRLTDLDAQVEAVLTRGDDDAAAALDTERAALLDELRRATGIGGRSRRLRDELERARKTDTARIRDTLRRLDDRHPELAEHLRASVSTGAACRNQPAREIHWQR